MHSIRWFATVLLVASMTGCATTKVSSQVNRDNVAWAADDTSIFAKFVEDFVKNAPVPAGDKSAMLARASILAKHSQQQAQLAEAIKSKGSKATESEMLDLQARAVGLREERTALDRELRVWQVQHGLLKPEDIGLIYVQSNGGC